MTTAEGWCFRTHAQNSRPLPFAYSPPSWSSLKTARMRSLPSTDILSKDENSERLSLSASLRCAVAAFAIALMMMFLRCAWHSPMYTLPLSARSFSGIASPHSLAHLGLERLHCRGSDEPLALARCIASVRHEQGVLRQPVHADRPWRRPTCSRPTACPKPLLMCRAPLLQQSPCVREDFGVDGPGDRLCRATSRQRRAAHHHVDYLPVLRLYLRVAGE